MKKLAIVTMMFAFAVSTVCMAEEAKKGGCGDKTNVVEEVVTLPVKTVTAVGEVVTGQAGKETEKK